MSQISHGLFQESLLAVSWEVIRREGERVAFGLLPRLDAEACLRGLAVLSVLYSYTRVDNRFSLYVPA